MTRTMMSLRFALVLASLGVTLSILIPPLANAQNQNMEVIHHPNYDKNVFMPFVPASEQWGHSLSHADGGETGYSGELEGTCGAPSLLS